MKQGTASIGSRPSSGSTIGPAMPLAPSSTTRMLRTAPGSMNDSALSAKPARTSRSLRSPCRFGSGSGPSTASRLTSPRPVSPPTGCAPRRTIFIPLYCFGLWEAVTWTPPS